MIANKMPPGGIGLQAGLRNLILLVVTAVSCWIPFLTGPLTVGASFAEHRYDQLVEQGKEAEAAGKWEEAIDRYEDALKISPSSTVLQSKLAALYFKRRNFAKTMDYCNRLLAANPRDPAASKLGGMADYQLNRFEQAARLLRMALATRNRDSELHYWLGLTLYALGDARQALDEFYRARIYSPKDIEVLYMIGKIHWQMSQQAWEEMVKLDPASVRVKQMVAEKDELWNLYPEAIAKYKEIIAQQPERPGFHYALGNLYLHVEKFEEAEEAFRAELNLDSHSPSAYYGLAEVALQRRDPSEALKNANEAVKEKPDYGDAYVLLGRIALIMGDKQKAIEVLERATTLSPSDPSVFYMLGHVYTELGKRDLAAKAVATYRQLKDEQEAENRAAR